ncbi:MAG: phytoene/squalene synthase family protein, partial [Kiritimatiellaceae bacterium]|nr:phytoene/squalene synthase family protein [Kiritimatiellaceae bacterium]
MKNEYIDLLKQTSRTFAIPILGSPSPLREAIASAYLCMRAIDEIEDDAHLAGEDKIQLLDAIGQILKGKEFNASVRELHTVLSPYADRLPTVTLALPETSMLAVEEIRLIIWQYTSDMAFAMAQWVKRDWRIQNEKDLDQYTFDVAGRVGLLLTRLWKWHDRTVCDDDLAVGFGRALQAVNIVRNQTEDRVRGVDFYPYGWDRKDMIRYARKQIGFADDYMAGLGKGPARNFCIIPLELARATLTAIEIGKEKLSRDAVHHLVP